jgi:hypothetical protein
MGNTLNSYNTKAKLHNNNNKHVKLHTSPHLSEGSNREKLILFVANDGRLAQAPQPPSPSPEGEGVQGMRKFNIF